MDREISVVDFTNIKKQTLSNIDHSRKGSVDAPINDLLEKLNSLEDFVSTSSCSGRIIITSQGTSELKKENCHWVYSTHDCVDEDQVFKALGEAQGYLTLKFEPFILHVQARTLTSAKHLLNAALATGFRNSGIVLGKHGKITIAARSSSNLEVPLSDGEKILVSDEFLKYCIKLSNEKLSKNFEKIRKFEEALTKQFFSKEPKV